MEFLIKVHLINFDCDKKLEIQSTKRNLISDKSKKKTFKTPYIRRKHLKILSGKKTEPIKRNYKTSLFNKITKKRQEKRLF